MSELNSRILIVDDDEEICSLLKTTLEQYGFRVKTALDGEQMFQAIEQETPDIIVLDIMLPGENGLSLCKRISRDIPVIMLTAMSNDTDKIIGLEVGADDYLAKPFNPRELIARVKAILRRSKLITNSSYTPKHTKEHLCFAQWKLNTLSRRLLSTEDDVEVSLSAGEYDLLLAMAENPQRILSREELLEITKNRSLSPFDRSIDVQISRLRQKVEDDPKNPQLIKTVRGGGYLFTSSVLAQ